MPQIMTPPAGCLGNIGYNGGFYAIRSRPAFLNHVNAALPPNGLDRCHSYSFSAMQQCLISILNRFVMSPAALSHISRFVSIFFALGDAASQQLLINAQADCNLALFCHRYGPFQSNLSYLLQMLNTLLSALNSVTGNLRYPASAAHGNSWNRSIGECYDIGPWFYVQNGFVLYDNTGPRPAIPAQQYMNTIGTLQPLNLPVPADGFCAYGLHDCNLLQALLGFNQSIGFRCAPIQYYSACDLSANSLFLYSSSNLFPIPQNCVTASGSLCVPLQLQVFPPVWTWQTL